MKQMLLFLLTLFFFISCEKEPSFEILEKEFKEEISLNNDPRVFVNFIKVHYITNKADVEKFAEIYATIVCEKARKIEQEFKKSKQLETRTGTPCFGLYHTRMVLNAVELAGCIILSYGTQTVDCYEDYVDDQEQAEVNFAKCLEETYP